MGLPVRISAHSEEKLREGEVRCGRTVAQTHVLLCAAQGKQGPPVTAHTHSYRRDRLIEVPALAVPQGARDAGVQLLPRSRATPDQERKKDLLLERNIYYSTF
jgi:hypothetical protein